MVKDRCITFSYPQMHEASNTPEQGHVLIQQPALSSGVAASGLNTVPCCPSFCHTYVYILGAIRITIQNVGPVFVNDKAGDFSGLLPRKQWACCWKLSCLESVHGQMASWERVAFQFHCLMHIVELTYFGPCSVSQWTVTQDSWGSLEFPQVWQFITQMTAEGGCPKGINKCLQ